MLVSSFSSIFFRLLVLADVVKDSGGYGSNDVGFYVFRCLYEGKG